MDTFEKIRALLAEQLDIDPAKITMDSDIMGDFEADSLDIVDMVMTLEDEFGIEVPDDAIESLRTVGDVVNIDCLPKEPVHTDVFSCNHVPIPKGTQVFVTGEGAGQRKLLQPGKAVQNPVRDFPRRVRPHKIHVELRDLL